MGIFSRSGVDTIDIPDLHRRKIIRLPENKFEDIPNVTSDGYFELGKNQNQEASKQSVEQPQASTNNNVTDFLSDFASIGASNPSTEPKENQIQSPEEKDSVGNLKWRIENLEFKLEQLIEKIDSLNR